MCNSISWRGMAIKWLYLAAIGHFMMGICVTWFSDSILFSSYNQAVFENFDLIDVQSAKALQVWWLSIFGATLQAFSILLVALIYVGDQHKNSPVWLFIISALIIWAPQDIYFSAMKNIWLNVWVDAIAVLMLLPPLVFLLLCDLRLELSNNDKYR